MEKVYAFKLNLGWKLVDTISQVDRFDASWTSIEKRETKNLKQLKSIATVRSVGASTRIEGSTMSDEEVAVLIEKLSVLKLEDRDSQEVAGYFTALDIVSESYEDIEISESTIKNLHNILLKFSEKDLWHRGNYKQHSNVVEAANPAKVRTGETVCVITYGMGVYWAKAAAEMLPGQLEIIDLRTLFPLDEEAVFKSVCKHGKAVVLSEEQQNNSFAEALGHRISHHCFHFLDARIEVVGARNLPAVPINIALEAAMLPTPAKLVERIHKLLAY